MIKFYLKRLESKGKVLTSVIKGKKIGLESGEAWDFWIWSFLNTFKTDNNDNDDDQEGLNSDFVCDDKFWQEVD